MNFAAETFLTDFATNVTLQGGQVVRGIFDEKYGEVFGYATGTSPALHVSTLAPIVVGDTVTVNAKSYTVTNYENDGTGLAILRLEEA